MRIRRSHLGNHEQPRLQMSSMIDVVFLLLIFFVMTFQITAAEGDVEISTDSGAIDSEGEPPRREVLHVHLAADSDGRLRSIQVDGRTLQSIEQLLDVVREMTAVRSADELSVNLRADGLLRYQVTMDALCAIRGPDPEQPLIQDVRFMRAE